MWQGVRLKSKYRPHGKGVIFMILPDNNKFVATKIRDFAKLILKALNTE